MFLKYTQFIILCIKILILTQTHKHMTKTLTHISSHFSHLSENVSKLQLEPRTSASTANALLIELFRDENPHHIPQHMKCHYKKDIYCWLGYRPNS